MRKRINQATETIRETAKLFLFNRNFLFTWTGEFFTQSAINIIFILIGVLSDEGVLSESTKQSVLSIAIILNLATLPGFFLSPFAGAIADRFSKKKIIMAVALVRIFILSIYILLEGWNNIWLSYALIFLLSTALQFNIPAEGGLIPKLVKKENMLLANSLFYLDIYGTMAIGVFASGIILDTFGIKTIFTATTLFFVVTIILISRVDVEEDLEDRGSGLGFGKVWRQLLNDMKAGVSYVIKNKTLRFILLHLFILQLIGISLATLAFRIGDEIFGVSSRSAGFVILFPMLVGVVLGFAIMNMFGRKVKRLNLIAIGVFFGFVAFFSMSLISVVNNILRYFNVSKVVAGLSLFSIGFAAPFLLIPGQTLIHESTDSKFRGRIMGIWMALTSSLASLFSLIFGIIADSIGSITVPILLITLLSVGYFPVILKVSRKLDS